MISLQYVKELRAPTTWATFARTNERRSICAKDADWPKT